MLLHCQLTNTVLRPALVLVSVPEKESRARHRGTNVEVTSATRRSSHVWALISGAKGSQKCPKVNA